jgi:hypothetical protein
MCRSLLCARSGCNKRFRPRGNQQYCSSECRGDARRVQNRRAKRAQRLRDFFNRCRETLKARPTPEKVSAIRRLSSCFRLPLRPLPSKGLEGGPAPLRILL